MKSGSVLPIWRFYRLEEADDLFEATPKEELWLFAVGLNRKHDATGQ